MILKRTEFIARLNIDEQTLESWIFKQWLLPLHQADEDEAFTDADVARANLIQELMQDFGLNQQGISVALHLLDQLHSVRTGLTKVKPHSSKHV